MCHAALFVALILSQTRTQNTGRCEVQGQRIIIRITDNMWEHVIKWVGYWTQDLKVWDLISTAGRV